MKQYKVLIITMVEVGATGENDAYDRAFELVSKDMTTHEFEYEVQEWD